MIKLRRPPDVPNPSLMKFIREQLVDTLTSIIFTGSVQHQALNAPHHVYSYMPHRPTILTKWSSSCNHCCHQCTTIIVTDIMFSPGGCLKRVRRTYLGLGSKRRFPQSHLPRSSWSCFCINSLVLWLVLIVLLFVITSLHQDIFELSMILATHSQCNLASLDVFEDDIPLVVWCRI